MCAALGTLLKKIPSALFMYILIEFPALLHTSSKPLTSRELYDVHEQDGRKFCSQRNEKSLFGAHAERN